MAHCALYQHGSDEITYFVRDCRKVKGSHPEGWDYIGSNCTIRGIKPRHFSERWTEDEPGKSVKALSEAKRYHDHVVSTRAGVNAVIREEIRARYSAEDELKILRQRIPEEFREYNEFIEELLKEGRAFKDENFQNEDEHE